MTASAPIPPGTYWPACSRPTGYEHLDTEIRPQLAEGRIVISDRYLAVILTADLDLIATHLRRRGQHIRYQLERQKILTDDRQPARLYAVFEENAQLRVTDPVTRREQLAHFADMAERPRPPGLFWTVRFRGPSVTRRIVTRSVDGVG